MDTRSTNGFLGARTVVTPAAIRWRPWPATVAPLLVACGGDDDDEPSPTAAAGHDRDQPERGRDGDDRDRQRVSRTAGSRSLAERSPRSSSSPRRWTT